ncbi:MAG: hypothetical protein LBC33_01765 [Mycoplasmataceae bacterium]|nr:hypothetical protein [Mycoplasmataceae bacterium]
MRSFSVIFFCIFSFIATLIILILFNYYFTYKTINYIVSNNVNFYPALIGIIIFGAVLTSLSFSYEIPNLVKNICSVFFKRYVIKRQIAMVNSAVLPEQLPTIACAFTFCNDFLPDQALHSMEQDYPNIRWYILDDSTKPETIKAIDEFANQYHLTVVRRPQDGKRTKSANLAHFWQTDPKEWDFFCQIDSGNILPKNFISTNLKFFYAQKYTYKKYPIGVVYSAHVCMFHNNLYVNSHNYTSLMAIERDYFSALFPNRTKICTWLCSKELVLKIKDRIADFVCDDSGIFYLSLQNGFLTLCSTLTTQLDIPPMNYIDQRKLYVRGLYFAIESSKYFIKNIFKFRIPLTIMYTRVISTISLIIGPLNTVFSLTSPLIFNLLGYNQGGTYMLFVLQILYTVIDIFITVIFILKIKKWKNAIWYFLFDYPFYNASLVFLQLEAWFLALFFNRRSYFVITPKFHRKFSFWATIYRNRRSFIIYLIFTSAYILTWFFLPDVPQATIGFTLFNYYFDTHIPTFFLTLISYGFCQIGVIELTLLTNVKCNPQNDDLENHNYQFDKYIRSFNFINKALTKSAG